MDANETSNLIMHNSAIEFYFGVLAQDVSPRDYLPGTRTMRFLVF